jgi:hypothetical protein
MALQINPSGALALYQSGKSLRAIAALFPGTHPMEVQRVLKRTGCYEPRLTPPPRRSAVNRAHHALKHHEAKVTYWKQRVEELQKAAE